MSNLKTHSSSKLFNPMHSSYIFQRRDKTPEQPDRSKISLTYTKATSEFQYSQNQDYSHLVNKYESRIKNLEAGYERSKEQYENSLKNLYKEKTILLNIISHSQALVDQFRLKIKMNAGSNFKEVETKYNIIASGLFHNQLCSNCILKISNTDFQTKSISQQKDSNKGFQKLKHKKLFLVKQYSWMYVPTEEILIINKLKMEISKIKSNFDGLTQESARKINDKNKQIQTLKSQLARSLIPTHNIILPTHQRQTLDNPDKLSFKNKEKLKQLQSQLDTMTHLKEKQQIIIKEVNEKLMGSELQRLNMKYRTKFF